MVFTLSCSDGNDGGGGSSSGETFTESFAIKEITDDSFTYVEYEDWECMSDGKLEKDEKTRDATYSINNGVLTLKWSKWSDTEYDFNGKSSELIGTWTRNKDKKAHCQKDEDGYIECDYGYDVTKAVFTQNSVSITRDFCWTDEVNNGHVNSRGWTEKVIDCSTAELRKGNEVVKYNIKGSGNSEKWTLTYKGKSCEASWSEPSKSSMEEACEEAVKMAEEEGGSHWNYYEEILYGASEMNFIKCLKDNNFPMELFGGSSGEGNDGYEGAAMLKKKLRR
jgi:hypothetical protein